MFPKNFTKDRWATARSYQTFYEQKTGNKLPLKSFYKSDNAITQNFFSYEVTFGMEYQGENYQFFIPQESMTIQGYGSENSEMEIIEKVKGGVASNFNGGSANWIHKNTDVKIRGLEKNSTKYNSIDLNQLQSNNVYASNIPSFEVGKGRTQNSANKNKYNLNIWL